MALIEVFHVVASQFEIDANATPDIPQGSIVSFDANCLIELCDGTNAPPLPLGIAGDSRSAGVTSYTPESGSALSANPTQTMTGSLVIGAWGAQQRYTQNRVADQYNEVLASGKMTVYHSGGEFWTSEYETLDGSTVLTYTCGDPLYCSANGQFTTQHAGAQNDSLSGDLVAVCLREPMQYPSGVPGVGEDGDQNATAFTHLPEGGNSMGWGEMLHIKLLV